jgi:hypothetical protein
MRAADIDLNFDPVPPPRPLRYPSKRQQQPPPLPLPPPPPPPSSSSQKDVTRVVVWINLAVTCVLVLFIIVYLVAATTAQPPPPLAPLAIRFSVPFNVILGANGTMSVPLTTAAAVGVSAYLLCCATAGRGVTCGSATGLDA